MEKDNNDDRIDRSDSVQNHDVNNTASGKDKAVESSNVDGARSAGNKTGVASSTHASTRDSAGAVPNDPSGRRRRAERQRKRKRMMGIVRTILLMLVALAAGFGVGYAIHQPQPAPQPEPEAIPTIDSAKNVQVALPGRTTVTEAELDAAMGTYAYRGEEKPVTVREAIEENTSLEAARNADGTYELPSADTVLAIARNRLLLLEAQSRGLDANDEEMLAYARDVWKSDDMSVIAASYGMSEDQAKNLMKQSASLRKLREEVVATKPLPDPAAPAEPEDGKVDEPKEEYGKYVVELVGDEWDAGANKWAREDGPYYAELKNFTVSNDKTTYSAAEAAYKVALAKQAEVEQQIATEWTAYVNQMLSDVTVTLGTLVA